MEYKYGIKLSGYNIWIPVELAEGDDDEAIKDYVRKTMKNYVRCQRLVNSMTEELAEGIHVLEESNQFWTSANADVAAIARVNRMPEIKMIQKSKEEVTEAAIRDAKERVKKAEEH